MGKSSPDTPNVVGAAEAEGQASRATTRDQTYANRPDQYNTFGSNTWQQEMVRDPATGEEVVKWTNREQLSPEMQELYNQDINTNLALGQTAGAMSQRVNDAYAPALDWDQFGEGQAGPSSAGPVGGGLSATLGGSGSGSGYVGASGELTGADLAATSSGGGFSWDSLNRGRAEDAAYARSTSRLDPQWEQKRADFERTMAGRGLRAGDSAFDSGMQNFDRGSGDAYEQARLGSVEQGRIEDQQSYGQAHGAFTASQAAAQQAFQQQATIAANARAAEQQKYDQGYNDWQSQQRYDEQLFDQQYRSGQNNREADSQAYNQEAGSADRANALRNQNISEYLGMRDRPGTEQANIRAARDASIGNMGNNYSSGG
jgi:hypothetical protein